MKFTLIKETDTYIAENCNCNGDFKKAIVTFSNSCDTSLAYISADSVPIGVCALSSIKGKIMDAQCEIDAVSHFDKIEIKVDGDALLHSIEFSPEPIYSDVSYTKVEENTLIDFESDTWEATDMLGRKVASVEDVGAKKDKKVGIFYWTWHDEHTHCPPVDVTEVLDKFPAAEYNENHSAWGVRPITCFWHEPLYGFYKDADPYVIRHHMSLLACAGVDFLMFDCTNGALLWRTSYEPLFAEMHKMRQDGIKTPQIAFMLNFGPQDTTEKMLTALYQNIYKPGLYSDLWFRIDGKPVVMGYPDVLDKEGFCESHDKMLKEMKEFFAFRPGQPLYGGGAYRDDQWGWLEKFPQNKYRTRKDGSCEMMTVGVAQNCNDELLCTYFNNKDTYGRSYTHAHGHKLRDENSYKYGYNFQEQWDRVIDISPDIAFVTGWNEWIMGQWKEPWIKDKDSTQLAMVDQYNREFSRDIEMDKDGHLDSYYLQLVSNIRRFKGATPRQKTSAPKTIDIKGNLEQWDEVSPLYLNHKGTTIHRDFDGFKGCHYTNTSGRNDIISCKVTRDDENLYFSVTCAEEITKPSDNWMTLFIDCDRDKSTGWEGYDFAINRLSPNGNTVSVERFADNFETVGHCDYALKGNNLQIKIPREMLGLGEKLDFEFKWSDNMQSADVMDFYLNGDCAPIGRFNYLYKE